MKALIKFLASVVCLIGVAVLLYLAYITIEPAVTAAIAQVNSVLPGIIQ